MPAARPSKTVIDNAVASIRKAGLVPSCVRIGPDGSLTIDINSGKLEPSQLAASNAPAPAPKKWGQSR